MKRFYIAVLLFMLPIFVFVGGAEYAVRQIPNEYKYKNDWMDQHAEEVETLIMGSSHAMFGINPAFIDGVAFNLGLPSQSLKYDLFLLHKWENRYKRLKTVIVPISYFTFFFDEPFGLLQAPCYYKNYMDCHYYPKLSIYSLELAFFKALHGKIITQRDNNWKVICDERGWHDVPGEVRADDWDDVVKAKGLVKVQTGSFDNVELNYSYLKEMTEFCHKRNIRLTLVTIPTSKVYNRLLDSLRVKTTYAQVSRIQKEFGLVYLDYREDNRFTSDDFADANHLNPLGAEKFTKILMNDINAKGN